jgi:DNA repair photolyase
MSKKQFLCGNSQETVTTKIIYEPAQRANEYSKVAANFFNSCDHGCKYCYSPRFKDRDSFYNELIPKKGDTIEFFESDLKKLNKNNTTLPDPILFSFSHDPYQNNEQVRQTTSKAIQLCKQYNVPFQVLTKGGLRSIADFDHYFNGCKYAATLTFIDNDDSKHFEPGAALPMERIEALKIAHDRGIPTWVSFEPVIDPDQVYELFNLTYSFVDHYKIGKISGFTGRCTDWSAFGMKIVHLCESKGKSYYLKRDLLKAMDQN